jgi:hypothetical protein
MAINPRKIKVTLTVGEAEAVVAALHGSADAWSARQKIEGALMPPGLNHSVEEFERLMERYGACRPAPNPWLTRKPIQGL